MKIVKKVTWWELQAVLAKREEFRNTTGKFRGTKWDHIYLPPTGQMSLEDRMQMMHDISNYGIDYIVWSYATPIGWRRGDRTWFSPEAGYSQTTKGRHLSRLRPAIAALNELAA